jgi:hypothetical protein
MVLTNFPNGVSSFGIPVFGGGIPPFTGNYYFVDYVNGLDGNEGTAEMPFKTLAYAYSKTTSGKNDIIFIVGDGEATATQRLTATLVWANSATHLIGLTAPTLYASRARISHLTTAAAAINPLVQVTGGGCIFANFSLFQGIALDGAADQLWTDEGNRNYYGRVHFGGMGATGSSAGANDAASYSLYLNGGGEHLFEDCVIGLDTIARDAANASLKVRGETARNVFRRCEFPMYATATSPWFVDANAANSINRSLLFDDCRFINITGLTSSASADAVCSYHANQNGMIIFNKCTAYGADDWTASDASNVLIANCPATSGDTGGFAVTADAT